MRAVASAPPLDTMRVALAGNPNTGKTCLFNALTGARRRVANYAGVTVEAKTGRATSPSGTPIDVVDVPGCYSLTARSLEEEVAHDVLLGQLGEGPADVIVVVADASNLERNLYLALQVAELRRPTVLALNMFDVAEESGIEIDAEGLGRALGMTAIPVVATTGRGVPELLAAIETAVSGGPASPPPLSLSDSDRSAVETVQALLEGEPDTDGVDALWLLTSGEQHLDRLSDDVRGRVAAIRTELARAADTDRPLDFNRRVILARYAVIDRVCGEHVTVQPSVGLSTTERVDRVVTHPVWGMAIFALAMTVLFQAVFSWSEPMIEGVEIVMTWLAATAGSTLPEGVIRELVTDGIIAGIGNILVFLPQILLLFLAIGLLEETGYMSRAALLLDRVMRRVGLHGKAFVPLLSSFACAVPGVMAARTVESASDRLVTIMVAPLMSCAARLPVYTLIIAAVFSTTDPLLGFLSVGGLVITAMYFLGIVAALAMAWAFKRTLLKAPTPPLILELPDYKRPSAKVVLQRVYWRGRVFVIQTGSVILALSVCLWALMSYPRSEPAPDEHDARVAALTVQLGDAEEAEAAAAREQGQLRLRNSIAGHMGRGIEPLIEPLGFDWKIGIGLIGSFAAREVLVSTLGQVYGVGSDVDEESVVLREALLADIDPETGRSKFTPLVGLSLMVFFVLAMQCLSTVATVRRETASWRWPIIMIVYMNVLAWVGAFLTYQVGSLMGYA